MGDFIAHRIIQNWRAYSLATSPLTERFNVANLFYLLGSVCFAAGTIINMVRG